MKTLIVIMSVLAVAFLGILILGMYSVGVYNTQVQLKELYEAKVNANKTELSNLKSKLPEAAQVTDAQMSRLQELFTSYAESRSGNSNGAIMTWVQEAVPNIDQTTFRNLQNIIVASRDSWTARQTELVDIARQYNTNLVVFPKSFILRVFGKFEKIDPQIVVTSDTNRAFETGVDEAMNLFKN